MKLNDLLSILKENGWYLHRQGKGSHAIFKNPQKTNFLTVPMHKGKEIGTGLCEKILKDAGIK